MKKIIFASAATLLISMLAGCTAADDTQISAPRSKITVAPSSDIKAGIAEKCEDYVTETSTEEYSIFYCRDDSKYYGCDKTGACQEIVGYDEDEDE